MLADVSLPIVSSRSGHYLTVNEKRPQEFVHKLAKTSIRPGLLLAVGFERAFVGAAGFPGVTGLVLLDFNSEVVRHANLNIGLLKYCSENSIGYVQARTTLMSDRGLSAEFRKNHSQNLLDDFAENSGFLFKEVFGPSGIMPASLNYWTNAIVRDRLLKMIYLNRIVANQVDLLDFQGRLPEVVQGLKRRKERVTLLDLSNLPEWIFDEMGVSKGARALREIFWHLSSILDPDAAILFTYRDLSNADDTFGYQVTGVKDLAELSALSLRQIFAPTWNGIRVTGRARSYLNRDHCGGQLIVP